MNLKAPGTHIRTRLDVNLHGATDALAELQKLVDRLVEYQAHSYLGQPLQAEVIEDVLSSPARRRLARPFDAIETWCRALEAREPGQMQEAVA